MTHQYLDPYALEVKYPDLSVAQCIDAEIASQMHCPRCGGPCHYYGKVTASSYLAFAVCDNIECGEEVEF